MSVKKIVDLTAYEDNLKTIEKLVSPSRVMAVIKADAYGHGLVESAKAAVAAGIDLLGVLDIETALELRKEGVSAKAFAWLHSPASNFGVAAQNNVELSVGSISELERIASSAGVASVHLKIDTGLSRNGCRIENWLELVTRAAELQKEGRIIWIAIWSHLSGASTEADEASIRVFERASEMAHKLGFTGYRHIASSPAAFSLPASRYDLVRIGVSAFGTSPIEGVSAHSLGLNQVMKLEAEVLGPGVISIGFLHGYFSLLAGKSHVAIGGRTYRVLEIGPVASKIEAGQYEVGDLVGIFGPENSEAPTAEELCVLVNTVTDELFTGLKANSVTYTF